MWGDLGEKMIVLSAESDQHMKVLFSFDLFLPYIDCFVNMSNPHVLHFPGSRIDGKKFKTAVPND